MNFLKGILIGITMMIPGLSGGSCAMILKVYDKLMDCISNIFNLKNLLYILVIGSGILIGILSFSLFLYKFTTYSYFNYIILSIIIINIILLLKEYTKFKLLYLSLVLLGIISMLILKNMNIITIDFNIITYLLIGFLLAISLILPGLGASYVLFILGLYDKFNISLINFDILFLVSISISTLLSILLTAKIINWILRKDKFIIYSVVIGLLIGGI